jgi:hypothetical protein
VLKSCRIEGDMGRHIFSILPAIVRVNFNLYCGQGSCIYFFDP